MPFRSISIYGIVLFFIGVIIWTFEYGPAKRSFIIPGKTVSVNSAEELVSLLHTSGVHGRAAVIFARYINNKFSGSDFPDIDYIDIAMRRGMIRTAYLIVPDRFGSEVVSDLYLRWDVSFIVPPKITDYGLIVLQDGGRIHVMPLSKYVAEQEQEKALVVIEEAVWLPMERARIDGLIRHGQLTSDLTVLVSKTNSSSLTYDRQK